MALNSSTGRREASPEQTARAPRTESVLRRVLRLGPFVVAVGVGKVMLDYFPTPSEETYRYLLALACAVAAGALTGLAGLALTRRQERAELLEPALDGGYEQTQEALLRCRVVFEDPELGTLAGWPHFIEEADAGIRPTAIGTAYGLKISLALDPADGRLGFPALASTLWKLRLPDGGWAARTQTRTGRPEVTALVLGALSRCGGDPSRFADAVAAFEEMLDRDHDPVGMTRVYVVSAALAGLVRFAPESPRLPELRRELVAGAIRDPRYGNLLCWADELASGRRRPPVPSVPHTARAVVALSRAARVLEPSGPEEAAVKEGLRWLVRHGSLEPETEQIRRTLPDHHRESLTVRHFTAAWVARALLCDEAEEHGELLRAAVGRGAAEQRDGVWEWANGEHPLWMTYQGVTTLRDHTLRAGRRP